jgi:hypothetical protein
MDSDAESDDGRQMLSPSELLLWNKNKAVEREEEEEYEEEEEKENDENEIASTATFEVYIHSLIVRITDGDFYKRLFEEPEIDYREDEDDERYFCVKDVEDVRFMHDMAESVVVASSKDVPEKILNARTLIKTNASTLCVDGVNWTCEDLGTACFLHALFFLKNMDRICTQHILSYWNSHFLEQTDKSKSAEPNELLVEFTKAIVHNSHLVGYLYSAYNVSIRLLYEIIALGTLSEHEEQS